MDNYSLADIATATQGGAFGGSNEFIWIFALLILFGGGGFGWNRNNGDFSQFATSASQSEILLGQKFDALGQKVNQIGDGICSLGYSQLQQMDANTAAINGNITSEGRALQTQLAECCCTTQRGIDSVNYNSAINTAAINANTTAQTQKILDAICQNKIETLQGQVNALQMQNAMAGVVKYPSAWTYNAGASPFCNCGSCCSV